MQLCTYTEEFQNDRSMSNPEYVNFFQLLVFFIVLQPFTLACRGSHLEKKIRISDWATT